MAITCQNYKLTLDKVRWLLVRFAPWRVRKKRSKLEKNSQKFRGEAKKKPKLTLTWLNAILVVSAM